MARLGSSKRPVSARVRTERDALAVLEAAEAAAIHVVVEIAEDLPEDTRRFEKLLRERVGGRPSSARSPVRDPTPDETRTRRNRRKRARRHQAKLGANSTKRGSPRSRGANGRFVSELERREEEELAARVREQHPDLAAAVKGTPPGMPGASEVLLELVAPFLDELPAGDLDGMNKLCVCGMTAWNAMVAEENNVAGARNLLRRLFDKNGIAVPRNLLDSLLERKLELFAEDARQLIDVGVHPRPGGQFRVNVMATYSSEMWEGQVP